MALKKGLVLIKLVSTAGTGYFLMRQKNPKNPVVRKHVLFEEKKA